MRDRLTDQLQSLSRVFGGKTYNKAVSMIEIDTFKNENNLEDPPYLTSGSSSHVLLEKKRNIGKFRVPDGLDATLLKWSVAPIAAKSSPALLT